MCKIHRLLILMTFMLALSSCYRMPDDDCVSTIPMTNNPQVVPQRGGNTLMPSASY